MSSGFDGGTSESLQAQLSRIAADMAPLIECQLAVRNMANEVRVVLDEELKRMRETAQNVAEIMKDTFATLPVDAAELARAGWVIPSDAPIYALSDLADLLRKHGREALDQHMIGLYGSVGDGLEHLQVTATRTTPPFMQWAHTIGDAFWAYKARRYSLVIPAGLAVLEGLVSALTTPVTNRQATNPISTWKKHSAGRDPERFAYTFWIAIDVFLVTIWSTVSFENERPEVVNRHWVHHGRCPDMGGQADALRLLLAISAIADYWDVLGHNEESTVD